MNKLEKLDVVVAVERRVNENGKFHLVRLADFCTQLLYLPVILALMISTDTHWV